MKTLTFVQDVYIYYIYLLLVDEYSDMEEEAGPQVGDAQKDEIAKKAEKEKKREATVEMTITKEAPEKGKVSIWTNKVTAQEQNLANF